jgi:hypothetical protein
VQTFTFLRRCLVLYVVAIVCKSVPSFADYTQSNVVARYIAHVAAIKEIQYRCYVCTDESTRYPSYVPRFEGLVVNSKVDVKWNLNSHDYYHCVELFPMDTPPKPGYDESSLLGELGVHGTTMEGYMSDDSSGLGNSNAGMGSIGPIQDHLETRGPELMMGYGLSRLVSKQHMNLVDMLESREITQETDDTVLIKNCMKWQGTPAVFDCKVRFAAEHRCLPQQVIYYTRLLETGASEETVVADVLEWGVTEASQPYPSKYRVRWNTHSPVASEPYYCVVSDSSVRFNPGFTESDFIVKFPSTKKVFNAFSKQVLVDGIVVEDHADAKAFADENKSNNPYSKYFWGGATIAVVIMVYLGMRFRSRRLNRLAILFPILLFDGCGTSTVREWSPVNEFVAVRSSIANVEIDLDSKPGACGFEFQLRNTSSKTIEIENISATCGCSHASCDLRSVASGKSTVIRGSISRSPTSVKKVVGVNVRCRADDEEFEIPFQVNVDIKSKWMPVVDYVLLDGEHNYVVPISFEVHSIDPIVLRLLTACLNIDGRTSSMDRKVIADEGRIIYTSVCKLPNRIGTEAHGEIAIGIDGEPKTRSFAVTAQTRSMVEWSPRAVVFEKDDEYKDVLLRVSDRAAIARIKCDDAIRVTELPSDSPDKSRTFRMHRSDARNGMFTLESTYTVGEIEFDKTCLVVISNDAH